MVTSLTGCHTQFPRAVAGLREGQRLAASDVPVLGLFPERPCAARVSTNRQQLTPMTESAAWSLVVKQCDVILEACPVAFSEFAMAPRANWKGFLRLSLV